MTDATLDESWRETSDIPKDGRQVEVIAPPHGQHRVRFAANGDGHGIFVFVDKTSHLMVPIAPIAWRPVA